MSKDLNLCQFIGRLGQDPEMRYTNDSKAVATLSIACGNDYKDKQGNKVEQTEWIRVVAFNRLAEIIGEYTSKGSQVYVSGRMTTRKWQDSNGQDKYTTEVVANEMQMLGGRGAADSGGQPQQPPKQQGQQGDPQPREEFDDDIPF